MSDVLDLDRLEQLRSWVETSKEDEGAFAELMELYLKNSATYIDKIKQAADDNDLTQVGEQAHKLKGTSLNFGASQIAKLSETIELQMQQETDGAEARDGEELSWREAVRQLDSLYDQTKTALLALIQ
ncbi:Hpt domain-containing protein [Brevibacillus dissolubilis]|uniref:Hpt domain-containing protein n=1 Tax=Brevibacillus dissolubilis TaxID=1844116 RepID=UPI0011165D43|nr:Hpt domain-containing protein [Brevibacillus dissolubilis]